MKVYHYTTLENWHGIKRGSWKSKDKPGIGASRRMGQQDMEAWETGAAFALLEPQPDNWVNSDEFNLTWSSLRHDVGPMLLEIEVDPEQDQVFVVDRGHVEGYLYENKEGISDGYLHETRKGGERAYMESKVRLKDYLERADELGYSLPEVVFTEGVPFEKIGVSENQPFIEEELRRYQGEWKQSLIRDIKNIPELASWYKRYNKEKDVLLESEVINIG